MNHAKRLRELNEAGAKATGGTWFPSDDPRPGMEWNVFATTTLNGEQCDILSPFHAGGDVDDMAEFTHGNIGFAVQAANARPTLELAEQIIESAREYTDVSDHFDGIVGGEMSDDEYDMMSERMDEARERLDALLEQWEQA